MNATAHHIDLCLAHLGQESFAQVFCDFAETLEIDQIMVFSIGAQGASCLLSRHFREGVLADVLAAQYLDGWYREDPLLPQLLAAEPDTITLHRLEEIQSGMSDAYRKVFFNAPGLQAKTTVMGVRRDLRLFISLYQSELVPAQPDPTLARLVGAAGALAFWSVEAIGPSGVVGRAEPAGAGGLSGDAGGAEGRRNCSADRGRALDCRDLPQACLWQAGHQFAGEPVCPVPRG